MNEHIHNYQLALADRDWVVMYCTVCADVIEESPRPGPNYVSKMLVPQGEIDAEDLTFKPLA